MSQQHPPMSFQEFLDTVTQLSPARSAVPADQQQYIVDTADELQKLETITRDSIAAFIAADPNRVPVLALALGLSQEQLKNQLKAQAGTSGWINLGRDNPLAIVDMLDRDGLDLLTELTEQRHLAYTWSDVLIARAASKTRAGRAISRGRDVEDQIEAVADQLGLSYEVRTRFVGRDGRTAPCDLAIPSGGQNALIVVAAKGFDSTGSKLTDAVREVEEMSQVRLPRQYVYAVVDGIGWLNRQADLQRIYSLWKSRAIDDLYTLARFDEFATELTTAAIRLELIAPTSPPEVEAALDAPE